MIAKRPPLNHSPIANACFRFVFICLIGLTTTPSFAQSTLEFYRAEVPVKDQTRAERKRASQTALLQVLLRMSATEAVLSSPEIAQTLDQASRYIEQFQYKDLDDDGLLSEGFREWLVVAFAPSEVRRMLTEARLPFWSEKRPSTLVWLVEDSAENGRILLNQTSPSPVIAALQEEAKRRGLPLQFPMLDLDDQLQVTPDDVWNMDEAVIAEASERYRADVVLLGRYSTTSRGDILSIWQFFHAGTAMNYDSRVNLNDEATLAQLGSSALGPLADFLSERYAIQPHQEAVGQLVLQLSGVKNYAAYHESLDYLEGLAAISGVHVAAVRQDSMLLYLDSKASVERLLSLFELGNRMEPVAAPQLDVPAWQLGPQGTLENPLRFDWSR